MVTIGYRVARLVPCQGGFSDFISNFPDEPTRHHVSWQHAHECSGRDADLRSWMMRYVLRYVSAQVKSDEMSPLRTKKASDNSAFGSSLTCMRSLRFPSASDFLSTRGGAR